MTYIRTTNCAPIKGDDYRPRALPAGWERMADAFDGAVYAYRAIEGFMTVILSVAREEDGRRWLHVSLARPERLPSWDDLRMIKDLFIGKDKLAVQVLPPTSNWVNEHPYCLHLFHCLDGAITPDFTRGHGTL